MKGPSWPSRALARGVAVTLLALTIVLSCRTAGAQVNAETLRTTLKTNPRFLWLEGSLVGRAGNTETMSFSGSVFGGLVSDPHLFFSRVSADYGEARGQMNVSRWMAHARYNFILSPFVALEALTQVQHDSFRRLAVRDLYGTGLRFMLLNIDDFEIFTGTTYLLEHEVLDAIPGSPRYNNVWHRSSNYGGVNVQVSDLVTASTVTYLQPRFDRPLDFRVLSDSFVSFTITPLLSARISATFWYDNRPPAGVRTYDVEVKNSLVLKL
ncbi:MAG: DUF481 domain-containing protein [Labilithrix sp.]|nr:DUF481 domain-containing protein [Labilithrix sp.]